MAEVTGSKQRQLVLIQILKRLQDAERLLLQASDSLHKADFHNMAIDQAEVGDAGTQVARLAGISAHLRDQLAAKLPPELREQLRGEPALD